MAWARQSLEEYCRKNREPGDAIESYRVAEADDYESYNRGSEDLRECADKERVGGSAVALIWEDPRHEQTVDSRFANALRSHVRTEEPRCAGRRMYPGKGEQRGRGGQLK